VKGCGKKAGDDAALFGPLFIFLEYRINGGCSPAALPSPAIVSFTRVQPSVDNGYAMMYDKVQGKG
jgi:hypothetical protein